MISSSLIDIKKIKMKNKVRADYKYSINRIKKRLAIVDLNLGQMSVTNCIEDVVEEIMEIENINPSDYMIIYQDSAHWWDGWIYDRYEFVSLACGTPQTAFDKFENIIKEISDD
jgi:hypothetical protein